MKIISEYFFEDNENKQAVIVKEEKGYFVHIKENTKTIKIIDVSDHSLRYAEDTAENYCLGIAK